MVTGEKSVNQRSESSQFHLLDQTSIFFKYFWSIELDLFRATIVPLKVYQIVNAHMLIRAKKDDDRREIDQSALWTSSISISESNLNIF